MPVYYWYSKIYHRVENMRGGFRAQSTCILVRLEHIPSCCKCANDIVLDAQTVGKVLGSWSMQSTPQQQLGSPSESMKEIGEHLESNLPLFTKSLK